MSDEIKELLERNTQLTEAVNTLMIAVHGNWSGVIVLDHLYIAAGRLDGPDRLCE